MEGGPSIRTSIAALSHRVGTSILRARRGLFVTGWVRIEICADETKFLNAAFKLRHAIACIFPLLWGNCAMPRKRSGWSLTIRAITSLTVRHQNSCRNGRINMPHGDGPWTNKLDIDISIIHEFEMALLGILKLFVGHL